MIENRDDDGETGASDNMLYLLQKMGLEDIVVVVGSVCISCAHGPNVAGLCMARLPVFTVVWGCFAGWRSISGHHGLRQGSSGFSEPQSTVTLCSDSKKESTFF